MTFLLRQERECFVDRFRIFPKSSSPWLKERSKNTWLEGAEVHTWPGNSLDRNLIGILWSLLKDIHNDYGLYEKRTLPLLTDERNWHINLPLRPKHNSQNILTTSGFIQKEWGNFERKLITGMPNSVKAFVNPKGGRTKYKNIWLIIT